METQQIEPTILLVEDTPTDVLLTKEAFKDSTLTPSIHVASDGEEALQFIRQEGKYADAPEPHLILLDLNMPRKNGFEFLEEIKKDPKFSHIPIVILTTSDSQKDIMECYRGGASSYISKPLDFKDYEQAILSLETYWFKINQLPRQTY
ncbi:MAG: response regulator [Bacteroidota bacterium]